MMNHAVPFFRGVLCSLVALVVIAPVAQAQFGGPTPAAAKPAATATVPPAAAAPAVEPPYNVASKLYEQGKQQEALVILLQLAEAGDARAQYLVGLDMLEAVYIPRNNAQGLAYLLLAGEDKQWGDLIAPRAREARALVEPQLSGAELVRADALVGEYRARHAKQP